MNLLEYFGVGSFDAPISFSSDNKGMPREFMGGNKNVVSDSYP